MTRFDLRVLLGITLILQACGGNSDSDRFQNFQNNRPERPTSVETINVSSQDISKQVRSFGNIKAQDIVRVTPQVSNRITQIHADLGDTVNQGDALAQIYDKPFKDQYEQARAQLEQNRANFVRDSLQFVRQKKLYDRDLISSSEFDNARATYQNSMAELQSSKANLTQSREDLGNTVIRSPVYGVVLTRNIAEGDLASSGEVAFEIANLIGYETRVYLPMAEWRAVDVGQKVMFRLSNERTTTAEGTVSRISPRLDPVTGLGEVVISLTETRSSIYQGVLVEAIINIETHPNAVVVPRSALVENIQTLIKPESNTIELQRTYSVFAVQGDSLALKRELQLGIEQGDKVEVLNGLQAGDQIVITGQNSLEDSAKVRIAGSSPFQQPREIPIQNRADLTEEELRENRKRLENMDDSTRNARIKQLQQRRKASQDTGSANTNQN